MSEVMNCCFPIGLIAAMMASYCFKLSYHSSHSRFRVYRALGFYSYLFVVYHARVEEFSSKAMSTTVCRVSLFS
jgi:uncharacterized protein involved in response to NO